MEVRRGTIHRKTNETDIEVTVLLDGSGIAERATGDLHIDDHHTVEDVGIAIGKALDQALGDRAGIERYGHAIVPMDEALALCALDISGRGLCVCSLAV